MSRSSILHKCSQPKLQVSLALGNKEMDTFYQGFDVMPSEQGESNPEDYLVYSLVTLGGEWGKLGKLKQYKKSSKKQRKITSNLLCSLIDQDVIWVKPCSIVCKVSAALLNGEIILSELLQFQEEKGHSVQVDIGKWVKLNTRLAKMYANYAFVLALMSGELGRNTQNFKFKKGFIVLDRLPGDKKEGKDQRGLNFIRSITQFSRLLSKAWNENTERYNLESLGFGYGESPIPIGANMTDWIAQSCHAAINKESYIANLEEHGEERRQTVAKIIFSIYAQYERKGFKTNSIIMPLPKMSSFESKNHA